MTITGAFLYFLQYLASFIGYGLVIFLPVILLAKVMGFKRFW